MKPRIFAVFALVACASALAQATAPDALVRNVTQEVIAIIKRDKDIQAGNPKKVAALIETKILPHFDFARMTQLAVGRSWRQATPEQQKQLAAEFQTLLVRTYSSALSNYRDQVIDVKPLRGKPAGDDVTVHSEVRQTGSQPVAIDYDLEKTPEGWKVYDVKVDGVSLVTTYRDTFAEEVRQGGVEGLIKSLQAKNHQGEKTAGKT